MNEVLKDAYIKYGSAGFILQKAKRDTKFCSRKGPLSERVNDPWRDNATGYVAVVPPTLIIVDNDSYKDPSVNMMAKLCEDLHLDYTPEPFALTPSGGEHYAFNNPHPELVIGDLTKKYPNLDIYSGYQTVIPIVGTQAMNKQGEIGEYYWADDIEDDVIINHLGAQNSVISVLKMRSPTEDAANDYDDDGLTSAIKDQDMPIEEVRELIAQIPTDYTYDGGWLKTAMALYDRFEGSDEGLELFQQFSSHCTREDTAHNAEYNENKWRSGHFKPSRGITYKTLRSLANEGYVSSMEMTIKSSYTNEDFQAIIEVIATRPRLNTTMELDQEVRTRLSKAINERMKEVRKTDKSVDLIQARTILPMIEYQKSPEEAQKELGDLEVRAFIVGDKYALQYGDVLIRDIGSTGAMRHLKAFEVPKKTAEAIVNNPISVSNIDTVADYLSPHHIIYNLEESPIVEEQQRLIGRKNPLHGEKTYIDDSIVIDEFFGRIWNGKLEDMMKLIMYSIRFKETKKTKLMLVAPSDLGKTAVAEHIGFQKVKMEAMIGAMSAAKGLGKPVISGLFNTGFLLLDETDRALPREVKELGSHLMVDKFGKDGTQIIPLHFVIMTSTHRTAVLNASDEIKNRVLLMELHDDEPEFTIVQSDLYNADPEHYTAVVKSYMRWYCGVLLQDDATIEELRRLQEKYRLEGLNDLDEFISDVIDTVRDAIKAEAGSQGEIIMKNGQYYIKGKKMLREMISQELQQLEGVDVGKYTEKIFKMFMPNADETRIKVDGTPQRYYHLEMHSKIDDDMFENLDEI